MPLPLHGLVYALVQLPLVLWAGLLLLLAAVACVGSARRAGSRLCQRYGHLMLTTFTVGILAVYAGIVVWYLQLPAFADEVEPLIASVSWAWAEGCPLYHGFDDAARYSTLYGPMVYVSNGLFLEMLGPSMLTAKVAGALAAACSLLFLYLTMIPVVGRRGGLYYTGGATLFYFVFGPFSWVSRPDPFLLAAVTFGLLCATRARRVLAVAGLAAAMALSANLKLHAVLCFLPALAIVVRRFSWIEATTSMALGAGLTAMPFVLSAHISITNYVLWLREATRHGLDWHRLLPTARFALFFTLPLLVLLFPLSAARPFLRQHRLTLAALGISVAGLVIFALKPGASLMHLMPMLPIVLYLSGVLLRSLQEGSRGAPLLMRGRLIPVLACLTAAFCIGSVAEYKFVRKLSLRSENAAAVLADLATIQRDNPGDTIGMACGGEGRDYELVFFRPNLIFAGQPLLMDIIAVMEGQKSGRPLPEKTYEAVANGTISLWLVPKGSPPFLKRNWYPPHQQVFPEDFLELVHRNYQLAGQSEYFDLWRWNPPQAQTPPTGNPPGR
jgi:hypothetical protein